MCQQNGIQQLVHFAPQSKKHWSYVADMLKTKCKSTTPREFPGYWWQFWTQHFSRYGARLVEERRWTILIFGHFRFAPLKRLLYVAITTVDCFKLLCVLLDASIAPREWYHRENADTLIGATILKSGHPYIWATLLRAHNIYSTRCAYPWMHSLKL